LRKDQDFGLRPILFDLVEHGVCNTLKVWPN
jgi:hypothetical protein